MTGAIWSFLVTLIIAAVVLMIVSRFKLGLTVSGFGAAIIAALAIAVVTAVLFWVLGFLNISLGTGIIGAIIAIIVAAVVLMVSDRFVPGMKVAGFGGAIIAAIAIGVVYFILAWLLSFIGITI